MIPNALNKKDSNRGATPAPLLDGVSSWRGGIKLHTLLDHDGHIPAFVQVTDAKTPDIVVARLLNLPPGSITVFDRARNRINEPTLAALSNLFKGRTPSSVKE